MMGTQSYSLDQGFLPQLRIKRTKRYLQDDMQGDVHDEIILGSRATGPAYIVLRNAVASIEAQIHSGAKRIFIHSDLGNGKTTLLRDLKLRLLQSKIRAYSLTQYDDLIETDLRAISRDDGKKVFLVEDLFRNSDTIEKIIHQFPDDIVISTSRTSVFDLRNEKVSNVLGSDYMEFDINRLGNYPVDIPRYMM